MGIPKYHKWLEERYPQAFAEAQHERANHVYVDVNALLHDCMRWATTEDNFFQSLFAKLDGLFRTVAPDKTVFLAVDGPASCAKCLTQRQRRRAHAQKDARNSKGAKGWKSKGKGKGGLSNNMLTPGVPFMTKLTSALEYYAAKSMKGVLSRCESVTVSGARAIGEGEHKIVSQMLRNAGSVGEPSDAESHVISSGDADIFLLSLVQSACRKVRVVSERPQDQCNGSKRKRVMLQIWNAEALAACIEKELKNSPAAPRGTSEEASLRRDFALVSLLAGNDYLPELKCSLTPQKLWDQYLSLRRKKFPKTPLLLAEAVESLPLSHLEGGWARTVCESGAAFSVEPYEHFSFHEPLLLEFMTAASGGGVLCREFVGREAEGVQKYLEGLLWILEMYHHGYCADFYFVLERSLHSFASASLIAMFLSNGPEPIVPPRSEYPPMTPLACAICILPVQHSEEFLCSSVPALKPMFATSHALLGPVNSIERNDELADYKKKVSTLQQEMMSLRALGRDDSKIKAMLTAAQKGMEAIKKGGSDIDVVPLWEVDAEVAERCSGKDLPGLRFAPDVTLVRAAGGDSFSLQPPMRSMGPIQCAGLTYVSGEWPQVGGADAGDHDIADGQCEDVEVQVEGDADDELIEVEDEYVPAAQAAHDEFAAELIAGAAVEGYWPEDDTWLPATVDVVHLDGSLSIIWEDASQSDVPVDYVRMAEVQKVIEPPLKRARMGAR